MQNPASPMDGESDLMTLLKLMKPVWNEGDYVFCSTPKIPRITGDDLVMSFREQEGYTLVLTKSRADQLNFSYTTIMAWITLTVHSSLEAVGLTAAFSGALTAQGISCNVVAGFYHDHIFVPAEDRHRAMAVLQALGE